jgi:hypothetical protein
MFNLISHDFPKSLLGQTALMFIVLALVRIPTESTGSHGVRCRENVC